MNVIKMILKEAGGRFENAAGSINSKDNMFAGSSGNSLSDKIGGSSGNNNPIEDPNEKENETAETTTVETTGTENTPVETTTTETTETDTETFSDGRLKDTYSEYKAKNPRSSGNKGKLKNLDLNPMSQKPVTSESGSGSGGGMGAMSNMFQGIMGAGGDSGADAGDMGADASDMGDMADAGDAADAASDERLKNIFGDNEDAIQCFARLNAIKFVYNDKAKEIPDSESKGVDNDPHYGIKAQELAANPLTQSVVKRDPISDYLTVDVKELTTANTAIISEICKRILIIEKVLGIKVV